MRHRLALFKKPLVDPLVGWCLPLLGLSVANWYADEALDPMLAALLAAIGIWACARLHHGRQRLGYEFLGALPLPGRSALWLPFRATGVALLGLAAAVHLFESSGAAWFVARALQELVGATAGDLEYRRRALEPVWGFFAYPAVAYWSALAGLTAWRRGAPTGAPLWPKELVVYGAVLALLVGAPPLLESTLDVPRASALGAAWSLVYAGVAGACAVAVRRALEAEPLESSPLGGVAWES